jgi:hypothetical protein
MKSWFVSSNQSSGNQACAAGGHDLPPKSDLSLQGTASAIFGELTRLVKN